MGMKAEKAWNHYTRSVKLMYAAMLVTLHRFYGFGEKRLKEFEHNYGEALTQIIEYAADEVLMQKLSKEAEDMGYSAKQLLSFNADSTTLQDVDLNMKRSRKMSMAECAKAAELLKDNDFFQRGKAYEST